jgi:pilus assembly protein CpaB
MRNSRIVIVLLLALLMAGAAVLAAARWMTGQGAPASQTVMVALVDIGLGAKVTPAMLRGMDWPAGALPPGAFATAGALDGRITRTAVSMGEPVLESKLAPPGATGGLSAIVADGKRAMTVRVNDVVGVAGFALPGNFVDILVHTQDDRARPAGGAPLDISKIVLERILVLAVAQESGRDDNKPKVVNAVTLELTPEQVEKLDLARSVGSLSLVLRNQVDPAPVNTGGATKASLLEWKVVAPAAAPVRAARRQAVPPRVPAHDSVTVIKGMDTSVQQF